MNYLHSSSPTGSVIYSDKTSVLCLTLFFQHPQFRTYSFSIHQMATTTIIYICPRWSIDKKENDFLESTEKIRNTADRSQPGKKMADKLQRVKDCFAN